MEDRKTCGCENEARVRCSGNCLRTAAEGEKRCEAWGRHEWCQNYMVRLSLGKPEYFEEK